MIWFFNAAPYVVAVGAILLSLFEIIKDWGDYKKKWLRIAVAFVFIIVSVVSVISLHHDETEKTKIAHDSKVENDKLRDDLGSTRDELQKTRDALGEMRNSLSQLSKPHGPKAELSFTFVPFPNPPMGQPMIPVTRTTLPRNPDGSVHVEFTLVNLTKVDAIAVNINVRICAECKFAKEPAGLLKDPQLGETGRFLFLPRVHAMETYLTISLDIAVPPNVGDFPVGFEYRCNNCVLPTQVAQGTVVIAR